MSDLSTNLHNLAHGQLGTLVGSAFVSDGGDIYVWLPGLVCLLALGELIWRSSGLLIDIRGRPYRRDVAGRAVAGRRGSKRAGCRISVARATDVGVSYGAVCVLGALTASIPSRWRPAWIGWWLGIAVTGGRLIGSTSPLSAMWWRCCWA